VATTSSLSLRDVALDHDEKVRRLVAALEERLALAEIRNIDVVAHQLLFCGAEAVEGRGGEVERVGHSPS
jgi:hypothetical protein